MTKRSLGRLIYLIIVLMISGYAFYEYKTFQQKEDKKDEQKKIFPGLIGSQIQKIQIQKIKETIVLDRKDKSWYLIKPIEDKASDNSVADWLDQLLSQKVEIKKEKDVDWSEYGLDENTRNIELKTDADKNFQLNISNYSGFDGSFFIKKDEKLLLGDTRWSQILDKDFSYFRSYYLINNKQHPVSLHYRSGNTNIQLKWKNYEWLWVNEGGLSYPLLNSAIESYWTSLVNVLFDKEVQSYTVNAVKKYKLNKPYIELGLEYGENKKWSVKIGPKIKDKHSAKVSNRNFIFSLSESQVKQVFQEKMAFRDHKKPFQFAKDQVQFIEIEGNGINLKLQKHKEKNWMIVLGGKDEMVLNTEELENILNRVLALSAKKYFSSKKKFSSVAKFILLDKGNNPILQLQFSESFSNDKNMKNVTVSSSSGTEVMMVSFADFENIFSKNLLQKKEMNVNSENERNKDQKSNKD